MVRKFLFALSLSAIALAFSPIDAARAGVLSVTNGGFEDFTGGYNGNPSQLKDNISGGYTSITGWTVGSSYGFLMAPGTGDTTGSHSPQYNNTFTIWGPNNSTGNNPQNPSNPTTPLLPDASPYGGNYLALDGAASYHGTGISQTITGLTLGNQYAVSFYWAGAQQHGFDGDTFTGVQVSLGSESHLTSTIPGHIAGDPSTNGGPLGTSSNVSHGFTGWQYQTLTFTATASSEVLNFLALGTPDGVPPIVLLDGISFNAVPEPSTVSMLVIGVLGIGAVRLRRRVLNATA